MTRPFKRGSNRMMRSTVAFRCFAVATLACLAAGPCLARVMPNKEDNPGSQPSGVDPAVAPVPAAAPRQVDVNVNAGTGNNGDYNTVVVNIGNVFDRINDILDTALNVAADLDYAVGDWMKPYYGLAKGIAEVTQDADSIAPYTSEEDMPLGIYFKKQLESAVHELASFIAAQEPADDNGNDNGNDNTDNCNNCDYNDYNNGGTLINNIAVDVNVSGLKNGTTSDSTTVRSAKKQQP